MTHLLVDLQGLLPHSPGFHRFGSCRLGWIAELPAESHPVSLRSLGSNEILTDDEVSYTHRTESTRGHDYRRRW